MGELEDLLSKYEEPAVKPQDAKAKSAVLVVDDDASIRRGLHRVLSEEYAVILAKSALEGINELTEEVACIILDIKMRKMSGFTAYKRFKTLEPLVPIIFYTAYQSEHDLSEILNNYKPEGYIEKGTNIDVFKTLIKEAVEKCNLARANERQKKMLKASVEKLEKEITQREQIERQLRQNEKNIRTKNYELEEVNTTLKVLLQQIKESGKEVEESILVNVQTTILPYLSQLSISNLNDRQQELLTLIEANLNKLVSPFIKSLNKKYFQLTSNEIQVADLVRAGNSTKEISRILSLSSRTIEAYRESIREKIGIKNKKINLRTHLLSLQ